MPDNWRPLRSERITKGGYIEIKIKEPNKWQLKHIWVWINENGKIPGGHCVSFKDGDKINCDPINLELISRNANLQINRLRQRDEPIEIQPTVRTLGKLIAKTIDCERGN